MIFSIGDKSPQIHETAFVAPTASVIGEVILEANTSVWFGAVLRGDIGPIRVGEGTNIQDNAVIHEPTTIGKNCVIAHLALVHNAVLGDNVLVGNAAIVFGGSEVGEGAIIGAGAVVTPNTKVPPKTLMLGVPARPAGEATEQQRAQTLRLARSYVGSRGRYLEGLKQLG